MPRVQRKWEIFPGKNTFYCDGRIVMGRQVGIILFHHIYGNLPFGLFHPFFLITGGDLLRHPSPGHRHLWPLLCLRLPVPHRTDLAGDPRGRRCPLHLRPLQLVEDELLGPGDHPEGDERRGGEHREGDRATQWGRPGL